MEYKAPRETGGDPVQGFVIEMDSGRDAATPRPFGTGKGGNAVQWKPNDDFVEVYRGTETKPTFAEMQPGTAYMCRIACWNSVGVSPYSQPEVVATDPVPPAAPLPPTVTPLQKQPAQLEIKWACPEYCGGSKVDMYRLETADSSVGAGAGAGAVGVAARWAALYEGPPIVSYVHMNLQPGVYYQYRVAARNKAGWSVASAPVYGLTNPDLPGMVMELNATELLPTSLNLTWGSADTRGAAITEFQLEMSDDPPSTLTTPKDAEKENALRFNQVYAGPSQGANLSELLPATSYYFRVIAVNGVGAGKPSKVLKATTACSSPDMPAQPWVISTTPASITIQWSKPREHGAEITSYSVQVDGRARRVPADAVGAALTYTISDLEPKRKYKIKIQATNKVGDSQYSKAKVATTGAIPPLQPKLELVSASYKAITVKWRFPKDVVSVSSELELRNWWGGFDQVSVHLLFIFMFHRNHLRGSELTRGP